MLNLNKFPYPILSSGDFHADDSGSASRPSYECYNLVWLRDNKKARPHFYLLFFAGKSFSSSLPSPSPLPPATTATPTAFSTTIIITATVFAASVDLGRKQWMWPCNLWEKWNRAKIFTCIIKELHYLLINLLCKRYCSLFNEYQEVCLLYDLWYRENAGCTNKGECRGLPSFAVNSFRRDKLISCTTCKACVY